MECLLNMMDCAVEMMDFGGFWWILMDFYLSWWIRRPAEFGTAGTYTSIALDFCLKNEDSSIENEDSLIENEV